jgi:hypothetical protein
VSSIPDRSPLMVGISKAVLLARQVCRDTRKHEHSAVWLRLTATVAMATLCAACITTDRTADRYFSEFVDHRFTTLQEAMLVSRECWVGAWKYCDSAVPIGPKTNAIPTEYPPTLQAYQDDPGEWSRRIHSFERQRQPGAEPDHIVIYGGLPVGTTVKISQVLSKFDGENGSYWLAFATVQDGEFKGRRLLLPRAAASVVNRQFLGLGKCETYRPAAWKPL